MTTSVKNLLKCSIFILLTFFLVFKTGEIFIPERNTATYTVKGFYKMPKNSVDVLFLGDSSVLRAVSPMEIWDKHGIVSYNYSLSSLRTYGIYYLLQDALKTQKPEIVVIDPDTMFYHYDFSEPQQRLSMDYLKNNEVKYKMINDEHYIFSFEDKVSAFIPLLRYHTRWYDLRAVELSKITNDYKPIFKGFNTISSVKPNIKNIDYMDKYNEKIKYENDSLEYLDKIFDICKENDIELMILQVPDAKVWGQKQSELIQKYANENNINYLDLNTIDIGINWYEDTCDRGSHLNVLGALKVTDYVGNYLKENYNLINHKGEKAYDFWNDDYVVYKELIDKHVENAKENVEKAYRMLKEKNN